SRRKPAPSIHSSPLTFLLRGLLPSPCLFQSGMALGTSRAQLQYLGAGIILSGVGGISANLLVPLLTGRSTYIWIGPYFSLLLIAIVGHAIIRHHLMDLRLFVNRGLAYALTTVIAYLAIITISRRVGPLGVA